MKNLNTFLDVCMNEGIEVTIRSGDFVIIGKVQHFGEETITIKNRLGEEIYFFRNSIDFIKEE